MDTGRRTHTTRNFRDLMKKKLFPKLHHIRQVLEKYVISSAQVTSRLQALMKFYRFFLFVHCLLYICCFSKIYYIKIYVMTPLDLTKAKPEIIDLLHTRFTTYKILRICSLSYSTYNVSI